MGGLGLRLYLLLSTGCGGSSWGFMGYLMTIVEVGDANIIAFFQPKTHTPQPSPPTTQQQPKYLTPTHTNKKFKQK